MISPQAELLRGFAIDFLTAHQPGVATRIMAPGYRLTIAGAVLAGRDDSYLPATVAQLDQFPGLVVTVHDVLLSAAAVAMRFTEHGVSTRDGCAAAWGGITLFRLEDGRLAEGWAEEDYLARKRQLRARSLDPILPPHAAPWDQPVEADDPEACEIARRWIGAPDFSRAEEIACGALPPLGELIAIDAVAIDMLFAAGGRAAFHASATGRVEDGAATIGLAGILDIAGGRVARAQLCADRLGLQRRSGGAR